MKRFFHNNGLLLIIIAVLLAALLGIGAFFLGGSPLTNLAEILTTPFRAASSAVAEWAQDRYDRAFRYDQMEQANEELRQRLAELEGLEREYQDAIRERSGWRICWVWRKSGRSSPMRTPRSPGAPPPIGSPTSPSTAEAKMGWRWTTASSTSTATWWA